MRACAKGEGRKISDGLRKEMNGSSVKLVAESWN
jgi:hypothetical protein